MRAAGVVEADPVADGTISVLDAVEPVAVNTLFFDRADHALDHAVLLRAMGRDELLLEAIAADQGRVFVAGEDEPVAYWEGSAVEGYGRLRSLQNCAARGHNRVSGLYGGFANHTTEETGHGQG